MSPALLLGLGALAWLAFKPRAPATSPPATSGVVGGAGLPPGWTLGPTGTGPLSTLSVKPIPGVLQPTPPLRVGEELVVEWPGAVLNFAVSNPAPAGALSSPLQAAPYEVPFGQAFIASAPGEVTLVASWIDVETGEGMTGSIDITVSA